MKRYADAARGSLRYRFGVLRWMVMSDTARRRWVARRLNLAESRWLFILGVNNSGTTLLERIVALHPAMRALPKEGQRLTQALPRPRDFDLHRLWTQRVDAFRWTEAHDAAPALRAMYDWSPHFGTGRGWLVEKSPPNTVRSRWLQMNFQPASFIVVTRNPYAVCEGIRRRTGCTIEQAAAHWAAAHQILLDDLPQLQRVLHITYERLCDASAAVLREIETFLELPQSFDDAWLARAFDVHNLEGQPAFIENFNARSLERLSDDDVATISRIAGDVMEMLDSQFSPSAG